MLPRLVTSQSPPSQAALYKKRRLGTSMQNMRPDSSTSTPPSNGQTLGGESQQYKYLSSLAHNNLAGRGGFR